MKSSSRSLSDRKAISWLIRAVPELRLWIPVLIGIRIFMGVLGVGDAICLRRIIDSAVSGSLNAMVRGIIGYALLLLLSLVCSALTRHLEEYNRCRIENRLKLRLLDCLLYRDYSQVTAVHSGDWLARLTSDSRVVASSAVQVFSGSAGMIARLLSASAALLVLVPEFSLILLLGGALMMAATFLIRTHLKQLHRAIQEQDSHLRVFLTEHLGSLMILKSYQQESQTLSQAEDLMQAHQTARLRKNRFSNLSNTVLSLAMDCATLIGAAFCGIGILRGTLSYGTFAAVFQLISQLQMPLAGISGYVPRFYAMEASMERLMRAEAFSVPDSTPLSPSQRNAFRGFGLDQVSFTYQDQKNENRCAVSNLNLELRSGEQAAFTGPSGCGKSTVLRLLLGLYQPDSGSCYILTDQGRVPLTPSWASLFAYVPQGNHLMNGTIRQVVSFAHPEQSACDDVIYRALEIACAASFVAALPQGLDTPLGERGSGLSEGQMQRIAVARALFADRPVLLLDEATSALDADTEVRLLHNIRTLTEKTVLIVTHRPAALEIMDKIISFPEPVLNSLRGSDGSEKEGNI